MSGGPSGGHSNEHEPPPPWWVVIIKIFAIVLLAFLSAVFSGCDLGLMSLNPGQLEMLIEGAGKGDSVADLNANRARRVLSVRKDGNLLLCTVLLGNVAVNSAMAVLTADFTSGLLGGVITSFIVVTFGEIIPQSLCYRHGLAIGASLLPLLKVFLYVFYIVNKPVALILDKVFGEEADGVMDRSQMKSALEYQAKKSPELLSSTETNLLKGVLEYTEQKVVHVMVPFDKAFCLDVNGIVDETLLLAVTEAGYSRFPVVDYNGDKHYGQPEMVGLLHAKDLLVVDPNTAMPVKTLLPLLGRDFMIIDEDQALPSLMHKFRVGTAQLACVRRIENNEDRDPYWKHTGVVTLQDIVNAIMRAKLDEQDEDHEEVVKREMPKMFSNATGVDIVNVEGKPNKAYNKRAHTVNEAEAVAVAAFWKLTAKDLFGDIPDEMIQQMIIEELQIISGTVGQALYKRGVPANYSCLILSGAVHIYAGREAFKSTSTSWGFLGQEALRAQNTKVVAKENFEYIPDFSAYPEERARVLICDRASFMKMKQEAKKITVQVKDESKDEAGLPLQPTGDRNIKAKSTRTPWAQKIGCFGFPTV